MRALRSRTFFKVRKRILIGIRVDTGRDVRAVNVGIQRYLLYRLAKLGSLLKPFLVLGFAGKKRSENGICRDEALIRATPFSREFTADSRHCSDQARGAAGIRGRSDRLTAAV